MKRILLITIAFLMINNVSADLDGYNCYKEIILTGNTSGAQTDYQILLNISYEENMSSDFNDLRFTRADGTTLIDAWLESKVDNSYALVWVEFPTTPANTVEQTYYMYYGNAGVMSEWDIGETFLFGDDFESGNLNAWGGATSAYATVGAAAYEGNYGCDRTQADDSWEFLVGASDIQNGVWEMWIKPIHASGYPHIKTRYLNDDNYVEFKIQSNVDEIIITDIGGTGSYSETLATTGIWYFMRATLNDTSATLQVYDTSMSLLQTVNALVTDRTDAHGFSCYRDAQFDTYRVRKYVANPATYAFGAESCEEEEEDISGLTTINFYYPHNNTTTDIKYISNDGYNVTTSNYLSAENLSVVIIKDQIVSEDI
ncbi:MAG: DUF2341 domain-containing protein, partial [Deltaproteobacteria bacterium]|nr:DUF2341 domain-containing protein [Deltaproteobacteria bacterium]